MSGPRVGPEGSPVEWMKNAQNKHSRRVLNDIQHKSPPGLVACGCTVATPFWRTDATPFGRTVEAAFAPKIFRQEEAKSRFARSGFFAHASSGPLLGFYGPAHRRKGFSEEMPNRGSPPLGRWSASTHPPRRPRAAHLPARRFVGTACSGGNGGIMARGKGDGDKRDKLGFCACRYPHLASP